MVKTVSTSAQTEGTTWREPLEITTSARFNSQNSAANIGLTVSPGAPTNCMRLVAANLAAIVTTGSRLSANSKRRT